MIVRGWMHSVVFGRRGMVMAAFMVLGGRTVVIWID